MSIDLSSLHNGRYSYDAVNYKSTPSIVKISAGSRLYLTSYADSFGGNRVKVSGGRYKVGGDITDMCVAGYYYNITAYQLFKDEDGLISAEDLVIYITTGAQKGLAETFMNCVNLTKGPKMIYIRPMGSTNYNNVLSSTFEGCTSLEQSPTIVGNIYGASRMFYGCTKLKEIKYMGSTEINYNNAFTDWVSGVAASGKFIRNSALNGEDVFGTSAIPNGWTVELADA